MARIGAVVVGLVALAAAAAAVALALLDPNDHKALIEDWASAALGSKVAIEGPLELSRSLTPTLMVQDVRIGAGPGGATAISIDQAELSVVLTSLLMGPVHLPRVAVDTAEIDLPLDLGGLAGGGLTGDDQEAPRIDQLEFSKITIRDREGTPLQATVERAVLSPAANGGGTTLDITGTFDSLPLKLAAEVRPDQDGLTVPTLTMTLGRSDVSGDLAWRDGAPGKLSGKLTAKLIDLAELRRAAGAGDQTSDATPGLPLPTPAQMLFDLDLAATIARVDLGGGLAMTDLSAMASGGGGRLDLSLLHPKLGGGTAQVAYRADGTGATPEVSFKLDAQGVDLAKLAATPSPDIKLPENVTAAIDLTGRGAELKPFLATASGPIAITTGAAVINEAFINMLGRSVFTAVLPNFEPSHGAHILCSVLDFEAKAGKARSTALVIDSKRVLVGGGGAIDLATGAIDFVLLPTAKEATLAPLVAPVHVIGTLADPTVAGDAASLLSTAGHLLLGIVNPLSLATPVLHPDLEGDAPCRDPSSVQQTDPIEKVGQTAVDAVKTTTEGIGSALEQVEKGASKLLDGIIDP